MCNFKSFVCKYCNVKKTRDNWTNEFKKSFVLKRQNTCLERYGAKSPLENKEIQNKIKKTNLEKYGVEHNFQRQDIKDKIKKSHIEKFGTEEEFNKYLHEKQVEGLEKKYGVSNSSYIKETIVKRAITFEEHKKDPYFLKNIQIKKTNTILKNMEENENYKNDILIKRKETLIKKYGVNHNFKIPEVIEHRKKYFLETFGTEVPSKAKSVIDKIKLSWRNKSPKELHEIQKKRTRKYVYNDILFDSWPEVCAFIYYEKNNIDFIYKPELYFEYYYNNEIHRYFPDFLVENELIEIKGDHFFENGKMINPFNRSLDGVFEAKHQCMIDNNVKILTSSEYNIFLEFVENMDYKKENFKNEK